MDWCSSIFICEYPITVVVFGTSEETPGGDVSYSRAKGLPSWFSPELSFDSSGLLQHVFLACSQSRTSTVPAIDKLAALCSVLTWAESVLLLLRLMMAKTG